MAIDRPLRRLPLRDLLTEVDKRNRDLIENLGASWLQRVSDLRDLSRPVRRKSHYPTLLALQNALEKVSHTHRETQEQIELVLQALEEIRDHANRERLNRG